jgi:transposase InsO family protein
MRRAGVVGPRPKPRGPVTTESHPGDAGAPNLLVRQCGVARPGQVWVGDISEVWPAEGWWSVSTLLDWYARTVVGWAMRSRIDTRLVQDTLRMALGRRQPAAGLRHQSDRGSQDASHTDQDLLATQGIVCRMSRRGTCLGHAVAERFVGS